MRKLLTAVFMGLTLSLPGSAQPAIAPDPEGIRSDVQLPSYTSQSILPPLKESAEPHLLLADCLRIAYDNHPNLKGDVQAMVEAEARLRIVDASYLPEIGLTVNNTNEAEPSITRETFASVGVTQTIWDTGQRAKKAEAARADLRAAVRQFQTTWIKQVQSIAVAYIDLLSAEYALLIQSDNVARARLNLEVAQAFYKDGVKSMVDVTTAQVQVSQAEVSYAGAENNARVARIALAQAVGVPVEQLQGRPLEDLLSRKAVVPSRTDALAYLHEFHPSLTGLEDQAEANFATAEAARRANAPVLTGTAFYGNAGKIFPNAPIWQIQFNLSFPFYSPSAGPTGDASEAKGQQLLAQRDATELLLIQQLDTAISDIEGADERVQKATEAVQQALYNAELAYRRYKYGLSDITELINARGFVESSRSQLVQALNDLKTAEASFAQAMGQIPLPQGVSDDAPFLRLNPMEMPVREESLEHAIPHRPGPNGR